MYLIIQPLFRALMGTPTSPSAGDCVAVLWREEPASWKGHVGFYLREDDQHVYLLGGNQLEQVREHFYPRECVLSYRWPHQGPKSAA